MREELLNILNDKTITDLSRKLQKDIAETSARTAVLAKTELEKAVIMLVSAGTIMSIAAMLIHKHFDGKIGVEQSVGITHSFLDAQAQKAVNDLEEHNGKQQGEELPAEIKRIIEVMKGIGLDVLSTKKIG
jgi:hypothetical protein